MGGVKNGLTRKYYNGRMDFAPEIAITTGFSLVVLALVYYMLGH